MRRSPGRTISPGYAKGSTGAMPPNKFVQKWQGAPLPARWPLRRLRYRRGVARFSRLAPLHPGGDHDDPAARGVAVVNRRAGHPGRRSFLRRGPVRSGPIGEAPARWQSPAARHSRPEPTSCERLEHATPSARRDLGAARVDRPECTAGQSLDRAVSDRGDLARWRRRAAGTGGNQAGPRCRGATGDCLRIPVP